MALTQSDWTVGSVNGKLVASCSVIGGAAGDRYVATKLTPKQLDTNKPFTVIVTTGEDMTAAGTTVTRIYGAYSDAASVGSTGTLTSCALVATNTTDLDAGATAVVHVLPGVDGNVTQVTNASPGWSIVPPAPRLIFVAFTSADLTAAPATVTFVIYQ
jgi:hypothetical protein